MGQGWNVLWCGIVPPQPCVHGHGREDGESCLQPGRLLDRQQLHLELAVDSVPVPGRCGEEADIRETRQHIVENQRVRCVHYRTACDHVRQHPGMALVPGERDELVGYRHRVHDMPVDACPLHNVRVQQHHGFDVHGTGKDRLPPDPVDMHRRSVLRMRLRPLLPRSVRPESAGHCDHVRHRHDARPHTCIHPLSQGTQGEQPAGFPVSLHVIIPNEYSKRMQCNCHLPP